MADINKQVSGLTPFVMGIVIIAITLVIGIFIVATLQTTFDLETTASVINESDLTGPVVYANVSGFTLAQAGNRSYSVTAAFNSSSQGAGNGGYNITVATTQLRIDGTGVLTNATATTYTNLSVSYNYLFDAQTATSVAAADIVTGLSGGTAWITILIVVGFAVIVLGFLGDGLGAAARGQGVGPVY